MIMSPLPWCHWNTNNWMTIMSSPLLRGFLPPATWLPWVSFICADYHLFETHYSLIVNSWRISRLLQPLLCSWSNYADTKHCYQGDWFMCLLWSTQKRKSSPTVQCLSDSKHHVTVSTSNLLCAPSLTIMFKLRHASSGAYLLNCSCWSPSSFQRIPCECSLRFASVFER